ncbi:DNA-binding response regulator [Actinoplanes philippinensis]|uniref:DNA-binding response regulator, NarL/FixJ family, contains REC and HTH domains n=2 Tax=Actinoplanes philippinensis TaxID=35752 RepID=A0A1I2EMP9_9ACTN|nr:response regulator transcription factor [Actinoplanes philippinensis]GIE82544.1 DNA-binding response regulator [Actinoplanes philippinensis]SFE94302.1 DNA-binding response regulator, NarL/FixJ family, contains REC and HTH domains [Actinoplanes philippinensis]
MPIRVILADDQPLVRAGLAMLLRAEPDVEVVAEADDGEAAVELTRAVRPDVVIMDVRMPGMDGVAATRRLTAEGSAARVLILTTYHVDEAVYGALRAGASGFVLKDAAPQELVAAVRALAGGEAWLDPAVARNLLDDLTARPEPAAPSPEVLAKLTSREQEVLVLMAHGLSNREIAEHLVVGDATIKTHVARVLMKLGLRDRTQAVVAAYQSGLVRPGTALPVPAGAD